MKQSKDERSYQDFFKEEVYGGFVQHLLDKYGSAKIIALVDDEPIMTKKGVHFLLRKQFNEFLNKNPQIEKKLVYNKNRFFSLRNICDQPLRFPVDPDDDMLMVKQKLRPVAFIPVDNNIPRATKHVKRVAKKMVGQKLKGDWHEEKYISPKRLTIYFKRGYAKAINKSTASFLVESRSEAMYILLDKYKNKVAFADIVGTEEFAFVKRVKKPRKEKLAKAEEYAKRQRNRKLRGEV
jgi:hypothetical protein